MFEELPFMLGVLLFSILVSYLLLKYIPHPFKKIIVGFMIIGIVIHEFFHLIMCLITNTPIKNVKFFEKIKTDEGSGYKEFKFNGSVTIRGEVELRFLQAVLISFAPLLFSFWLFFLLLDHVIHPTNPITFFGSLFIILSIMFSAAPSSADLKCIPRVFSENPKYSAYQIFLLLLSILLVWFVVSFFQLYSLHEIIIYLLIMLFYYFWKYGVKMINVLYRFAIPHKNLKSLIKKV